MPDTPIEESPIDPADPSVEQIMVRGYSLSDAVDYCDVAALAANLDDWANWLRDNGGDPSEHFTAAAEG